VGNQHAGPADEYAGAAYQHARAADAYAGASDQYAQAAYEYAGSADSDARPARPDQYAGSRDGNASAPDGDGHTAAVADRSAHDRALTDRDPGRDGRAFGDTAADRVAQSGAYRDAYAGAFGYDSAFGDGDPDAPADVHADAAPASTDGYAGPGGDAHAGDRAGRQRPQRRRVTLAFHRRRHRCSGRCHRRLLHRALPARVAGEKDLHVA